MVTAHSYTSNHELLAVVIVLFSPILHETLANSNFDTNTICQLSHSIDTLRVSMVTVVLSNAVNSS